MRMCIVQIATEVVTCRAINDKNGLRLNGNRHGGPGSCFLKVRYLPSYERHIAHENKVVSCEIHGLFRPSIWAVGNLY